MQPPHVAEWRLLPGVAAGWAAGALDALDALSRPGCGVSRRLRVSSSPTAVFDGAADDAAWVDASVFLAHLLRPGSPDDALAGLPANLYLSQCGVLAPAGGGARPPQLPELAPALVPPPPPAAGLALASANLWASAGASIATTHADGEDNVLVVLRGRKDVALVPPVAGAAALAPHPLHSDLYHHARVGLFAPDGRHTPAGGAAYVQVGPGDGLVIPRGWWHSVSSVPGTVAVNFWYYQEDGSGWGGGGEEAGDAAAFVAARSGVRRLLRGALATRRDTLVRGARGWVAAAASGAAAAGLGWARSLAAGAGAAVGAAPGAAPTPDGPPPARPPHEGLAASLAWLLGSSGSALPATPLASPAPLGPRFAHWAAGDGACASAGAAVEAGAPPPALPRRAPPCPSCAATPSEHPCPPCSAALAEALLLAAEPATGLAALHCLATAPPGQGATTDNGSRTSGGDGVAPPPRPHTLHTLFARALTPAGLDALSCAWEALPPEGLPGAMGVPLPNVFAALWDCANAGGEGLPMGALPGAVAASRERVAADAMRGVLTALVGCDVGVGRPRDMAATGPRALEAQSG